MFQETKVLDCCQLGYRKRHTVTDHCDCGLEWVTNYYRFLKLKMSKVRKNNVKATTLTLKQLPLQMYLPLTMACLFLYCVFYYGEKATRYNEHNSYIVKIILIDKCLKLTKKHENV